MPTVTIDQRGLRTLIADVGKLPDEVAKQLRPRLRTAGQKVQRKAQANASWSSRIPGAIGLRVATASARSAGVFLRVNAGRAPHGRVYEGITSGRSSTFRHPVFGNTDVWVAQRTRPFLVPAVQSEEANVVEEVAKAVDDAARAHGF